MPIRIHKDVKRKDLICSGWRMQPQKNDLQPYIIYNPFEPCIARITPTSGNPMVPANNKEDKRSPVIRGETAAISGAKPAARTQPITALPGLLLLSRSSVKF